jgi:catechol 2,3-dioxygenase-like lactoylglutathione lyase family enzyme
VSLENFKKQAKLLVRWHRERNNSVAGRIRQLPRYEDLTDTEVLALSFPLNEAQEIVALEQGYNSWAELKQGMKKAPKTIRRASAALRLTKAMPVLYVSDVQAAADFYRDKLGFTIDFLHGQAAFYASVSRDEACIYLRFVHQPMYVAALREKELTIAAFLSVANVKGLFAEYQTRKVAFVHRLKKEPWRQSSFIVPDPERLPSNASIRTDAATRFPMFHRDYCAASLPIECFRPKPFA